MHTLSFCPACPPSASILICTSLEAIHFDVIAVFVRSALRLFDDGAPQSPGDLKLVNVLYRDSLAP